MTDELFQQLTANCQPHQVFSSDWSHYYSRDFADIMLPKVGIINGKAIEFYDGAEILPTDNKFLRYFLQLTPDSKLISLTLFSYPKGTKAQQKKLTVQPEKFELCVFFELDTNDNIAIFLKAGDNFKSVLQSMAKSKKVADISSNINDKVFSASLSSFQSFFKEEYSHYKVLAYVGKLLEIDLEKKHNATVLKVRINSVRAYTSEPSDNHKRRVKVGQKKYIKVDFELMNQSATSYSIYVFKAGNEIYKQTYLQELVVSNKTNTTPKPNDYAAGKYTIEWDCTDNKILDNQNISDKIKIRIQATNKYKETAISEIELSIKELIDKTERNNYILILKPQFKINADKTKTPLPDLEVKVFGNEIIERQEDFVKKIPKNIYENLTTEGKLILNLPVIMTKLNFIYGALCQIHWLEGTSDSLKFPYEFFMSEGRVKEIDGKNLEEYFEKLRYLSLTNLGYMPNNPDVENLFLYNDDISSVKIALEKFNENLEKRTENGAVGGNEKLINEIREWNKLKKPNGELDTKLLKEALMENYFQAFSIGSATGDLDDLGVAIGMYRQACYFRGFLEKNTTNGKWILSVEEVLCRFFDEFSFNDNFKWDKPLSWRSQDLGCWHTEIDKPKLPHYTKIHKPDGVTICLQNSDFQKLKEALSKKIPNSCIDYFIYSNFKSFSDEFIQKNITIL